MVNATADGWNPTAEDAKNAENLTGAPPSFILGPLLPRRKAARINPAPTG